MLIISSVGGRGQPAFCVSTQQLEIFLMLRFPVRQISQLLGVSEATIRRRIRRGGIHGRGLYSSISDAQLDGLVSTIVQKHSYSGYRMVQAFLFMEGYRLPEGCVQSSLEGVDPIGMAVRWNRHRCIHRRFYYAHHPNAFWHMDGNMLLVRWRFVIHGCIYRWI